MERGESLEPTASLCPLPWTTEHQTLGQPRQWWAASWSCCLGHGHHGLSFSSCEAPDTKPAREEQPGGALSLQTRRRPHLGEVTLLKAGALLCPWGSEKPSPCAALGLVQSTPTRIQQELFEAQGGLGWLSLKAAAGGRMGAGRFGFLHPQVTIEQRELQGLQHNPRTT